MHVLLYEFKFSRNALYVVDYMNIVPEMGHVQHLKQCWLMCFVNVVLQQGGVGQSVCQQRRCLCSLLRNPYAKH